MDAYIDIETSSNMEITVVGIYLSSRRFLQFVGSDIRRDAIIKSLRGVKRIFTYNGDRFDIPMIKKTLDIDLSSGFENYDLMYDCHRENLYGGLKGAETGLGIRRKTKGMDGYKALKLWNEYKEHGDRKALKALLTYNKEDTVNLHKIKRLIKKRNGKKNIRA